MLEQEFERLYLKFRLLYYQNLFARISEENVSLSAAEAFSAEVIFLLNHPTVKEFAEFLNISQSNATYKINMLITKGYIQKIPSPEDKREFRLIVTDKYRAFYGDNAVFIRDMMHNLRAKFTPEEIDQLEIIVKRILDEGLN
ncbi:MAG: MarR family winged helix-turn-helix transcriptional regulator [Oscillospiraceae bacterium]